MPQPAVFETSRSMGFFRSSLQFKTDFKDAIHWSLCSSTPCEGMPVLFVSKLNGTIPLVTGSLAMMDRDGQVVLHTHKRMQIAFVKSHVLFDGTDIPELVHHTGHQMPNGRIVVGNAERRADLASH